LHCAEERWKKGGIVTSAMWGRCGGVRSKPRKEKEQRPGGVGEEEFERGMCSGFVIGAL